MEMSFRKSLGLFPFIIFRNYENNNKGVCFVLKTLQNLFTPTVFCQDSRIVITDRYEIKRKEKEGGRVARKMLTSLVGRESDK